MKNPEKFKIVLEWNVEDVLDELEVLRGEFMDTKIELNTDECITILKTIEKNYDKIYGLKYVDISYAIRELVRQRGEFKTFDDAIKHLVKK